MTLDELTVGQAGTITGIDGQGPLAQRLMALGLLACDPGRVTGSGQLECDPDLLTGIFSHDNNEDLARCLQGRRPLTGG